MCLAAESDRFDRKHTVWPHIGGLEPLEVWKLIALNTCGALGDIFTVLSLFLPKNSRVRTCCCLWVGNKHSFQWGLHLLQSTTIAQADNDLIAFSIPLGINPASCQNRKLCWRV